MKDILVLQKKKMEEPRKLFKDEENSINIDLNFYSWIKFHWIEKLMPSWDEFSFFSALFLHSRGKSCEWWKSSRRSFNISPPSSFLYVCQKVWKCFQKVVQNELKWRRKRIENFNLKSTSQVWNSMSYLEIL